MQVKIYFFFFNFISNLYSLSYIHTHPAYWFFLEQLTILVLKLYFEFNFVLNHFFFLIVSQNVYSHIEYKGNFFFFFFFFVFKYND